MAEDMNNNNNNENGAENNQQQENTPKTVGRGFEAFFPCQKREVHQDFSNSSEPFLFGAAPFSSLGL